MERRHVSLRTVLSHLFLFWLHKYTRAQQICTIDSGVQFKENNTIGAVVTTINTLPGVTLSLITPFDNNFTLDGNNLIAVEVLDYETAQNHQLGIQCTQGAENLPLILVVVILDVNDNSPVFSAAQYTLKADELSQIGTPIGTISATDADKTDRLYYTLDPDTEGFRLQGPNTPNILVQKPLDYDTVQTVTLTLFARDTAIDNPAGEPSNTATATVVVNIVDIDNRPPWFQPCTPTSVGTAQICMSPRYRGQVNLTEQAAGFLTLDPGPVYAIDGDAGINEAVTYSFLNGNEDGIFAIDADSGNISTAKVVDKAGPLILTVLALQKVNNAQLATATVIFEVVDKSRNPPRFEQSEYQGFVSEDASQGSLVLDGKASTVPLRIHATDADFADGVNPNVMYEVLRTTDFFATPQGFILLAKALSPGTVTLELKAVDTSCGEFNTASLVVEVTPGIPTTPTMGPTTPTEVAPTSTPVTSTSTPVTSTSTPVTSTSTPVTSTGPHSEEPLGPGDGVYSPGDMATLGASLAVLLVICMVVIGLLVFSIHKGKADWRKLSEATLFSSSLAGGSGGLKDGVQYTNEGFQDDRDTGSTGSNGPEERGAGRGSGPGAGTAEGPLGDAISRASAPLHALLPDNSSLEGSDKADGEKEVKPILTKERRVEEGYKSVWFKEDIDPNAKEEVVIIPDSGERDGDDDDDEEEEEGSIRGWGEEDDSPRSTPKVLFSTIGDEDSGFGGPSNQDSDDHETAAL